MAAQVRHDQEVSAGQEFGDWDPKLATDRERVQQDDGWATACNLKTNFCVTAGDPFHAEIIEKL
jgi:hypothetical protein